MDSAQMQKDFWDLLSKKKSGLRYLEKDISAGLGKFAKEATNDFFIFKSCLVLSARGTVKADQWKINSLCIDICSRCKYRGQLEIDTLRPLSTIIINIDKNNKRSFLGKSQNI